MRYQEWCPVIINFFLNLNYNNMSSMRQRQALYGYAPGADPENRTTTCTDPITGRQVSIPAGATYNNGGNMKFGLYPTVGKSIGFLNILSNCCASNQTRGITTSTNGCSTA